MRLLVWQWGRRGAGPRFAADLAASLGALPDTQALLSLSAQAELLHGPTPPVCALPFPTYSDLPGFLRRSLQAPLLLGPLSRRVARPRPDAAICAMPAPLDLVMQAALRRAHIPCLVVVHDADIHPGDGVPLQMTLQRLQVRRADALIALSDHVATRLGEQGLLNGKPLLRAVHPPYAFGPPPPPPLAHGGKLRLLSFGRLLPYKGLDLLAASLQRLGARGDLEVRVVGSGPESAELAALRRLPCVAVENRWVPEEEIGALLTWADAVVLSHREASQSGVAAAALAAGRWVVATRVGGLVEQLGHEPLAVLCEPAPAALADAIAQLVAAPPALAPACDAGAAWRAMAADLRRQITGILPPLPAPERAAGMPVLSQ
jgi:glycosyltransferase involved in cell wall biosynthesis